MKSHYLQGFRWFEHHPNGGWSWALGFLTHQQYEALETWRRFFLQIYNIRYQRTGSNSMLLPTYPGKIPQTSPFTPKKKEFLHKLLVKHPGYQTQGYVGEILDKLFKANLGDETSRIFYCSFLFRKNYHFD